MKSARRQARIAKKVKDQKKDSPFLKFLIPIAIIALAFIFLKFNGKYWNGNDKVSLVYKEDGGNVGVIVADPKLSEITTLIIPKDTQVDVARNYGTLRIENVWQLGLNEKVGGSLLAETVTQNFLFPVVLWTNGETGIKDGNFGKLIHFVFTSRQTNIPFGDRLKIALFAMKIQDFGRSTIDLGKSKFLDKKMLDDGLPGYILTGPISQRLTIYFSDNELGDKGIKVNITDATGTAGVSEKLGQILEVVGGKIVSIDKKSIAEDSDCVIGGNNTSAVKKVAILFSCKIGSDKTSFDLDIRIGKEFAKRF